MYFASMAWNMCYSGSYTMLRVFVGLSYVVDKGDLQSNYPSHSPRRYKSYARRLEGKATVCGSFSKQILARKNPYLKHCILRFRFVGSLVLLTLTHILPSMPDANR